ncbi:TMEM175 family protein [Leucobacter luti]|uniref:TMEM175 family protein n=1 Tax=Leucobacter luti TaxID=340320 RepID=UPI003D000AEE
MTEREASEQDPGLRALERAFPAERAKAFTDAVIAIAMTLLILPLMESATELDAEGLSTVEWFDAHASQLFTFVLSFTIIGFFWLGHHRVFDQVDRMSNGLLWLTLLWLLSIVWLPVATALTGQGSAHDSVMVRIYVGSMFATQLIWLFIRWYLLRHPDLHRISRATSREGIIGAAVNALFFLIAGVIAALFPSVGYWALLILFLTGPARRLARIISVRRSRRG